MSEKQYCSQLTKQAGELLVGSAPSADHFIFITWPKKLWEYEALDSKGGFPKGLKKWIKNQNLVKGKISIRLISKPKLTTESVDIYIFPENICYSKIQPSSIQALLESHYAAEIASESEAVLLDQDQIFVCTHGRHDKCCAKFGQIISEEMKRHVENENISDQIWESSHLGGHRFAATLIDFPSGRAFGHLSNSHIPDFFSSKAKGQIFGPAYRGSVFLSEKNQLIDASIEKYFYEQNWLCRAKTEQIEELSETEFSCVVSTILLDQTKQRSESNIPEKLNLKFGIKETHSPAGCDALDDLQLRKCWELKTVVPA